MSIPKTSAWSWNIYLWSNLIAEGWCGRWNWDLSKAVLEKTLTVNPIRWSNWLLYTVSISKDWKNLYCWFYEWDYQQWSIRQYKLQTPNDISTATNYADIRIWEAVVYWTYPYQHILFNDTWTIMIWWYSTVASWTNIIKSTLSTPYDISTKTDVQTLNLSWDNHYYITRDWNKFWYSNSSWTLYKELSSPFNLSSWTKISNSEYQRLYISSDWKYLYYVTSWTLYQYKMSTKFDISSTLTLINTLQLYNVWLSFDDKWNKLYTWKQWRNNNVVYQYSLT